MRRRALLATLAGGTAALAGCNTGALTTNVPGDVPSPTGLAAIRPLDEPYVRHGFTAESEQYLYARQFDPGDSLPVTDVPDAADFSDAVDDLAGDEFAVLTNLRTAGAAPAYLWPGDTRRSDGRLRIELERRTNSAEVDAAEAVGVALATFEPDGDLPDGTDVVFPGGATLSI